ncbi:hypothetical protein [Spirosoma koreense]
MKVVAIVLYLLVSYTHQIAGQSQPTAKVYFYCLPSNSLIITQAPDKKIKIGNCTLLETNIDSIGIELTRGKIVYLHFELGKSYYYQRILSSLNNIRSTGALISSTEEAFWLSTYFSGMGTYRHYFLDTKSGLRLIEEKK